MERARAEFAAARFSVVLVTFGSAEGAAAWLRETGSQLRLLRDPHRALYTQLGLPRSVSRAWSRATLHWCASQQAAGREAGPATPPGWQDGDHLQMGGNFRLQQQMLTWFPLFCEKQSGNKRSFNCMSLSIIGLSPACSARAGGWCWPGPAAPRWTGPPSSQSYNSDPS